jgi:predicted GNAT superfamily acetyltransferase
VTVDIRELGDLDDLRRLEQLFGAVWGRPNDPPLSSDIMRALEHSGNYVAGAFAGGRMIGGLVGWLGGEPPRHLHMHSHILGVLPGEERRGTGFELKQHQRAWCLARKVDVMEWTTDPLVGRNVYFNVTKLGAEAPEYLVDFYGVMRDGINAGEESDRLLIRWQLDSPEAGQAATGSPEEPNVAVLQESGAAVVLRVGAAGAPEISRSRSRVLLCQVPADIVEIRRVDAALARSWRLGLRAVMTDAFDAGYELSGASRDGWYVLETDTH